MWPFIRSKYYFLSYKAYIAGQYAGGWRMRRASGNPAKVISNIVGEIEAKIGTEIIVTAFYAVR